MNKQLIYILTLLLSLACTSCVSKEELSYPNTPRGNMEALWHIIDEKYCFVEEKDLDWDGVPEVYLPKVDTMSSANYRGLFEVLAQMIDTLRDGHVNLYSSFDVSASRSWYEGYPTNYSSSLMYKYLGDYKTAGGLIYNRVVGHDNIGYIRYSSFSNSFSGANMYYVLQYFKDCDGIILDVRSNGGGSLTNSYLLASTFMDTTTHIGYWQHKIGKGHYDMSEPEPIYVQQNEMPYKWHKPVVVLCNRQSYSATNMFVNCMRYAPHATIIGGITGGGGGMPLSYELPNGWMIRFSSVRMMDRDMQSIEPGIRPNEEVTLTSKDKDDIVERAIEIVNS